MQTGSLIDGAEYCHLPNGARPPPDMTDEAPSRSHLRSLVRKTGVEKVASAFSEQISNSALLVGAQQLGRALSPSSDRYIIGPQSPRASGLRAKN